MLTIGKKRLEYGLFLAPMAGDTDHAFRSLCNRFGCEWTTSEMVSAKALIYELRCKKDIETVPGKTAPLAAVYPDETHHSVQLFGSEPDIMAEAAARICACDYRGAMFSQPPAAIDINMGCPMPKIAGNGEGCALMDRPELAARIVRCVKDAVPVPVTVKIRAGTDTTSGTADFAKLLEQSGASLICVHARTKKELYRAGIHPDVIRAVKEAVSIPVVGNGDIRTFEDAAAMMRQTGCDGIAIGRAALGNPWIFRMIIDGFEGRPFSPPSAEERIRMALSHAELLIAEKGERSGLAECRKHLAYYTRGMRGSAAVRNELMTAPDLAGVKEALCKILRTGADGSEACDD